MTRFRGGGLALLIGALALAASPPVAQGETMKPDSINTSGAPPAVDSVAIAAPAFDVLTFTLERAPASIAVQLSRNSQPAVSVDSVASVDSVTVTQRAAAEHQRMWRNERTAIPSTSSLLHANTVDNPQAPAERMRTATAYAASNPATYRISRVIGLTAFPLYL